MVSHHGIYPGTYLFWWNFMIFFHIFPLVVRLALPLGCFLPDVFTLYEFLSLLAKFTVVFCVKKQDQIKNLWNLFSISKHLLKCWETVETTTGQKCKFLECKMGCKSNVHKIKCTFTVCAELLIYSDRFTLYFYCFSIYFTMD